MSTRFSLHLTGAILVQSTFSGSAFILPIIAQKQFGASSWQTMLVTVAPLVLMVGSIFWSDFLKHTTLARYLMVYWAVALLPLAGLAFAQNYATLLTLHIVSAVGQGAWSPVAGELLRLLYPDKTRGRVFGVLSATMQLAGAGVSFCVGRWLNADAESFRWYMPAIAGVQLVGIVTILILAAASGINAMRPRHRRVGASHLARLIEPLLHTREILKSDRVFYKYEAAFMTYGVGWMICYALVPLMAEHKLHLTYREYTDATQVTYLLAMVLFYVPAGLLLDRFGPTRASGVAFALLATYPILLIFSTDPRTLSVASAIYGTAAAGVSVGWMLGPVSLAPTPAKVAQYVSIHATLVGLRGIVFQGLGVLMYELTGSFVLPLAIAAAAFAWGSVQMYQLHVLQAAAKRAAA
jgi:MFS family permease